MNQNRKLNWHFLHLTTALKLMPAPQSGHFTQKQLLRLPDRKANRNLGHQDKLNDEHYGSGEFNHDSDYGVRRVVESAKM